MADGNQRRRGIVEIGTLAPRGSSVAIVASAREHLFLGGILFRFVGNVLSPAGDRGKLSILIYHRARAAPDPILHDEIDAATFEQHMALLAANFNVLPLGEACARFVRGGLPARAACITFDDGYADNEQTALPILKRFGLQATFFVSTGFSEGRMMFNDGIIETVRNAPAGIHDLSRLGLGTYNFDDSASRRAAIDALLAQIKYRQRSVIKEYAESSPITSRRKQIANKSEQRVSRS